MSPSYRWSWAPASLLVLAACAGQFSPLPQVRTYLPPNDAERGLERTFEAWAIPVAEHALDGRVRSGRFDPNRVWGVQVEDRVSCASLGDADGSPRARPTELEVIATIRVNGKFGTRVELESYGRGTTPEGESVSCHLTSTTADGILASLPAPRTGS